MSSVQGPWRVDKIDEVYGCPQNLAPTGPINRPPLPVKYDGARPLGAYQVGQVEWKFFFDLGGNITGPRYLMISVKAKGRVDHPNLPPCFAREGRD